MPRPRGSAGRDAREGLVSSYIHTGGRVGVLIEVNCETDFVARTDEFQKLVRDLAVQVAGMAPLYVERGRIPAEALEAKKAELAADESVQKKPEHIRGQIVEGQLKKWYSQVCLLRPAVPRRGADGPRADHGDASRPSARTSGCVASRGTRSGRSCERRRAVGVAGLVATGAQGGLRYRRILLKLSGEALLGNMPYGVDPAFCAFVAKQVAEVRRLGVEVGIVVGGGNIFRGLAAAAKGMDRATGDYIGMLATVMNGSGAAGRARTRRASTPA